MKDDVSIPFFFGWQKSDLFDRNSVTESDGFSPISHDEGARLLEESSF